MLVSTNDVSCGIVRMRVGCWACASYYECTFSHSAPFCILFCYHCFLLTCWVVMPRGCSCCCFVHLNVVVVCLGGCLSFFSALGGGCFCISFRVCLRLVVASFGLVARFVCYRHLSGTEGTACAAHLAFQGASDWALVRRFSCAFRMRCFALFIGRFLSGRNLPHTPA